MGRVGKERVEEIHRGRDLPSGFLQTYSNEKNANSIKAILFLSFRIILFKLDNT
jgi:hypothetical protein